MGDIHAIAIDDRAYYLAGNGLFAADKIGGLPTTVSTEVASNAVGGLAAKDGLVYATDAAHARIIRVRGDGAGLQAIATGHSQPTALAVDDCFAYWSDLADGTIWRVDR